MRDLARSPSRASSRAAHPDALFAGMAIVCVAAVGAALVSQYAFDMQPCPWCVLQRVIYLAIALACVLGLLWRNAGGRVFGGMLALLLALAGVAATLWQHFVAAASPSCNLTLADRIVGGLRLDAWVPDVFAPRASCADAAVNLLGIPYDYWSLALFVLIAIGSLAALRRR